MNKTYKEVIRETLTVGPLQNIVDKIFNNTKDHFAHKFMIFAGRRKLEEQQLLIELFKFIFKEE